MDGSALALLLLVVAVAAAWLNKRGLHRQRRAVMAAAIQCGLEPVELTALGASPPRGAASASASASRHGAWRLLPRSWLVRGTWQGREVRIDALPGVRAFRGVFAPWHTPLGMDITASARKRSPSFHPSETRRVSSGDTAFDAQVHVQARDAAAAGALLARPAFRQALLAALEVDPSAALDDRSVYVVRTIAELADPAVMRKALDGVVRIVDALEAARRHADGSGLT